MCLMAVVGGGERAVSRFRNACIVIIFNTSEFFMYIHFFKKVEVFCLLFHNAKPPSSLCNNVGVDMVGIVMVWL